MGMNFSPMYQPVSTKTIKADGDLNVSPYDVEAYDGRFDTVEADEFIGGVGNFEHVVIDNDIDIKKDYTITLLDTTYSINIASSMTIPLCVATYGSVINGSLNISCNTNNGGYLIYVTPDNHVTIQQLSTTLSSYNIVNACTISIAAVRTSTVITLNDFTVT